MPTKPITLQRFTAWSYSRLNDYTGCPRKAKYKHLDRLKEPESDAILRGQAIHKLAEDFANKRLKKLPAELKTFADEFKALVKAQPITEQQWAFNETWGEADWFGKSAWCRMVVDVYYVVGNTLVIIDHKTGRIREEHLEQLGLYALGGFSRFPDVEQVEVKLWYLDQGEERVGSFTRAKDLKSLQTTWNKKPKAMMADTKFAARPGDACRWCHFKKANGGPCEY